MTLRRAVRSASARWLAGSQRSVPLLAQFLHLGVPCGWQAHTVAGTGTELLDAQCTQLGPRLLKASPKVSVLFEEHAVLDLQRGLFTRCGCGSDSRPIAGEMSPYCLGFGLEITVALQGPAWWIRCEVRESSRTRTPSASLLPARHTWTSRTRRSRSRGRTSRST
ncbi:hypothetical protein AB0M97_26990 [Streptomyces sp. NPDC051207]|uniref:hypothetical protein n=1 Tax=Streptomyces sp. NPDC051207 TaxID=3154641 RepID=UPI0034306F4A